MIRRSFIPGPEAKFNDWQDNFVTRVVASTTWGLTPLDKSALQAAQTPWTGAYAVGNIEADPTSSQRQAKRDARKAYQKSVRTFIKSKINNNTAVTNADRDALGLTVYDNTRTKKPVPNYAPFVKVETIAHLLHRLRITDPNNPLTRSKPAGASGMRVYIYIGTAAPTDFSMYTFYGIATRFLYDIAFSGSDVGKSAWYIVQYEGFRGDAGPLSLPASAIVI
jgi:hypothetical protein